MRITINPVLDIETLRWVSNDGIYEYDGPVLRFEGESADAKANEAAQTAFYKSVTAQQSQIYGEQQELYNTVIGATAPIIAKGPQQYGYTPAVDALLQTYIKDTGEQAETNTINATELKERQEAGGAAVLPTGANAQIEADVRATGEQSTATNLAQEKLSGYQAGSALYNQALSALSGVTGNPTQYTSAATGAGTSATGAINLADSERSNLLQTILGGASSAVVGGMTGGLGTAVSKIGSGDFGW
jgi:hypothetical protein